MTTKPASAPALGAHTPGPWSVGQTRAQNCDPRLKFIETLVCVGDVAHAGNCIASVGLGGPGAIDPSPGAVQANARLIAAAPDLFTELEATNAVALELMERAARLQCELSKAHFGTDNPGIELSQLTRMRGQLSRNRAAIAKAEGRA